MAVDKKGDEAVTHIAAALFFAFVLIGAAAVIHMTVREYWNEILAALTGEIPKRRNRPTAKAIRSTGRPRPMAARALPQHRAAA